MKNHFFAVRQLELSIAAALIFNLAIVGVQILLCGKINGNSRTQTVNFRLGQAVAAQTLSNTILYAAVESYTYTGVFGVHVWFVK